MPRSKKETLLDKEINEKKYSALAEFEVAKSKNKTTSSKKSTSSTKASTTKKTSNSRNSSARTKVTGAKKDSDSKKNVSSLKAKSSNSTVKKSKSNTSKKSTNSTATKKNTAKKSKIKSPEANSESLVSTAFNNIVEYYDLPYRYNQTVVKVLAQNPNTLFVYWDVSDEDIDNFQKKYGENFLYITKPVLLVHNLTDNYSFEIDINDFANNWYIHVNDAKCKYSVELCRRPNQSEKIENQINNQSTDFINISFSNTIEMPNDRILFFKDNDRIYFKNIKTNKVTETKYRSRKYERKVKAIYSNYNLSNEEDRFDFKNPSSQNPTSNVM